MMANKVSRPGQYTGFTSKNYDGWKRRSEYVTVRDGTRLAIDIICPTKAGTAEAGPLPVIWIATQYQRASHDDSGAIVSLVDALPTSATFDAKGSAALRHFLGHGYIIAILDMRGTGASFGIKHGALTANDPLLRWDLFDVAQWIGEQAWCDGNIGMYGISFLASTQIAAALTMPPSLKCIVPQQTCSSSHRGYMNINGIQNITFRHRVDARMRYLNVDHPAPLVDSDKDGNLRAAAIEMHKQQIPSLPTLLELKYINSWSTLLQGVPGLQGPFTEWPLVAASGVAIYHWGGWQDLFPDETLKLYATWCASNPSRVVMGPWFHTEQTYACDEHFDYATELLRWYDRWLKGIDNGIDREPPVLYFVQNAPEGRQWHSASSWPPPGTRMVRYYFDAGRSGTIASPNDGTLSTVRPELPQACDSYTVDYTTTTSGLLPRYEWGAPGDDYSRIERDRDYSPLDMKSLTYTSAPLPADTEITGHPVVNLRVSSDAPDVDFFVYLQEIRADGMSIAVTEGFMRASHRATGKAPRPNLGLPYHPCTGQLQADMPGPDVPVELAFEMLPTSRRFRKGSRIRITIFCYDKDNWDTPKLSTAPSIRLQRNFDLASYVELPVID